MGIKIPLTLESLSLEHCWQVIGWGYKSSKYWNPGLWSPYIFPIQTPLSSLVNPLKSWMSKNKEKNEHSKQLKLLKWTLSPEHLLENVLILKLLSFMYTENDIETAVIKHFYSQQEKTFFKKCLLIFQINYSISYTQI